VPVGMKLKVNQNIQIRWENERSNC
jgi:hypothetical protein